jgi:hypothetical protein
VCHEELVPKLAVIHLQKLIVKFVELLITKFMNLVKEFIKGVQFRLQNLKHLANLRHIM